VCSLANRNAIDEPVIDGRLDGTESLGLDRTDQPKQVGVRQSDEGLEKELRYLATVGALATDPSSFLVSTAALEHHDCD
jgi:hypothetical protein